MTSILHLAKIAKKPSRRIIGLMSGTSLDGLDIALCKISGSGLTTKVSLEKFKTTPYSKRVKERILEVFAKKTVDFVALSNLHAWIGRLHGEMVNAALKEWKVPTTRIDAIASHGQTVMHAPAFMHPEDPINSTFQAGDGDHVAVTTGILTVSDFRQKHIAAGGEGAPLAVYGDFLLMASDTEPRILLNLGGIANFTYLPSKDPRKVFVTDTGPGNTLLDQTIRSRIPGRYYDRDAKLARKGTLNERLLRELLKHSFFRRSFPKTTGPEMFNLNFVQKTLAKLKMQDISVEDLLNTITHLTARSVAESIKKASGGKTCKIYLSGGGAHNPLIVELLEHYIGVTSLVGTATLGISGDAKEAILFAVLANETLTGSNTFSKEGVRIPKVSMGKLSFPT